MGQAASIEAQPSKLPLLVLNIDGLLLSRYKKEAGEKKLRENVELNPVALPFLYRATQKWQIAFWVNSSPKEASEELSILQAFLPQLQPLFV